MRGPDASVLAEDFGVESPQAGTSRPSVARQPRFVAGVLEKGGGVPLPVGGDLRQQQSPVPPLFHNEPMTSDFDLGGRLDPLEWTEQRDFNVNIRELRWGDGRKSRIGGRRGHCTAGNDAAERFVR